jgi:hypothetical protein
VTAAVTGEKKKWGMGPKVERLRSSWGNNYKLSLTLIPNSSPYPTINNSPDPLIKLNN